MNQEEFVFLSQLIQVKIFHKLIYNFISFFLYTWGHVFAILTFIVVVVVSCKNVEGTWLFLVVDQEALRPRLMRWLLAIFYISNGYGWAYLLIIT